MTHLHSSHAQSPTRAIPHGGFKATALYRILLTGPAPKGPRFSIPELWPGDPQRGREILEGAFSFQSETHVLTAADDPPAHASSAWQAWFHAFGWLTDLQALQGTDNGEKAACFARQAVTAWSLANHKWTYPGWTAVVTADRIVNCITAWNFLITEAPAEGFEKRLRQMAGRDIRHLNRSAPGPDQGFIRLHAIKGQVYAAFALLGGERTQQSVLLRLENDIKAQVLPDGGHVERNPECLAKVLHDLLDLRSLCCVAMGQVPDFIQNAIDRSAPMLRALRHSDGGLALFNGGLEGNAQDLDRLLGLTDPTTTPPLSAPYTGFQKLSADSTSILMDCGKPGGPGLNHHAGTLSFEMCVGKKRLIVNCGARTGRSDPWRTALAATAAHSVLTVNDTSSAAFALDGNLRRGPEKVTCERQDNEHGTLIEASHDGYVNTFGLVHHRSLFLDPTGGDVRGEDRLVGTGGEYLTIRFHLHPDVHVSLLGGGTSALLRLDNKRKETWRLRISTGAISLEESAYLGHNGEHRRTEQIVISHPLSGNGALLKWSLSREGTLTK